MEQKVKFRISSYQTAIKKSLNHSSEIKHKPVADVLKANEFNPFSVVDISHFDETNPKKVVKQEIKRILKSFAVDSDEYKEILNSEYIYYPIQTENKRQVQIYSR